MEKKVPFGYTRKDRELQADEIESKIVQWTYKMAIEYSNNPPEILIEDMNRIKDIEDDYVDIGLSYEEATERVSFSLVQRYVAAELNYKMKKFEDSKQEDTADELQKLLQQALDEDSQTIVEKLYRSTYIRTNADFLSANGINQYVRKIGSLSEKNNHLHKGEPLISKEMYERARETIETKKEIDQEWELEI